MKIHEYQGKEILRAYNVPVPRGTVASSPQEARQAAEALGGHPWVVKAQIHAGGRGKGGGVQVATSTADVERIAATLLGQRLVTPQTRPEGQIVQRVLIEEGCNIAQELYCGIVIDRQLGQPVCMVSPVGGMDIEAVAATTPDQIFCESIDVLLGLMKTCRKLGISFFAYLGDRLGLQGTAERIPPLPDLVGAQPA